MGTTPDQATTSPYPRKFALGSETMRPKPMPLGVRIVADLWTLCLGVIYGLISVIPHWSIALAVPLIFAWRAYRVERSGVDFCSRTVALLLVGWISALFALRDVFAFIVTSEYRTAGGDKSAWTSGFLALFLLVVWLGTIVWRRLNRHELEPGGAYEAFRAGVPWYLIPAATMMMGLAEEMAKIGIGLTAGAIVACVALVSWRMVQTLKELLGTVMSGLLMFVPTALRQTYPEPTIADLGYFGAIVLLFAATIGVWALRKSWAARSTEIMPDYCLPAEEGAASK